MFGNRQFGNQDPIRGNTELWRFTPSLLHPNSFGFLSFANQLPGYYTPTAIYHNQAGDLHSLNHHPTNQNSFGFAQPQQQHGGPAFAPHQSSNEHAPLVQFHRDKVMSDEEMQEQSPGVGYATTHQDFSEAIAPALPQQPSQKYAASAPVLSRLQDDPFVPTDGTLRYHITLIAPTAMIKYAEEIPVTYLNKGQAYTISLIDTAPVETSPGPIKYRTYVRISFEDEQQRQRPAACWQLWKEGRGTNEAHQRGGRLQAVEFVDPAQAGGGDAQGRPCVELESASFDGFAVTWTPVNNSSPKCSIAVRFYFLSTDFSRSKGVKGIPVRFCAKTELVTPQPGSPQNASAAEFCYCRVQLFRDHGAERKLLNDVAHVKKTIDKLKQQIAQIESGKCNGSISTQAPSSRPGKVPKHKKLAKEDLHLKLGSLQYMFSSTRPVSVLYLQGDEDDDPDMYPVQLSGTPPDLTRIDTNVPTRVERSYSDDNPLSGWIEAVGVVPSNNPPLGPMLKPVVCFFVLPRIAGKLPTDNYFRAVYLRERSLKALVGAIVMKINIEPTKVTRTIRINQKGLQVLMDDEAVHAIPEQQDMTAELHEVVPQREPVMREWNSGPTDIQVDGDAGINENVNSTRYELRLLF